MSAERRRPNIVLITTDQQRWDTVGPDAPPWMRTPHLDNLAREGVTFTRAYADCPVCIPSRVSIMTGLQGFAHGMTGNGRLPDGTLPISRERSLPARLRQLGYQTAAVGKMHFMPQRARYGFEEMILPDDYYHQMARFSWFNGVGKPMDHGLGQNELYPGMATVPESYTLTAWIVDQCVEYVKRRRDPQVPFFLWCSFTKPHPPLDPPEPYYSMYRNNPNAPISEPWLSEWSAGKRCPASFRRQREAQSYDLVPPEVLREARAAYYGLITQIDYNIGRLFAALQDLDELNDAMFLFTSDHGELLGDHHGGAKSPMYEGSAHVPLLLRLPRSWEERPVGRRVAAPVCVADVYQTCLSAAGGEVAGHGSTVDAGAEGQPASGYGRDLTALADGNEPGREWLETACGLPRPSYHGLTDGRWKYIYHFADSIEQLFSLIDDPHEMVDLADPALGAAHAAHAGKLAECRAVLVERLAARGSPLVRDGRLVVTGLGPEEPEERRRARPWPGYHTTEYHIDVRH